MKNRTKNVLTHMLTFSTAAIVGFCAGRGTADNPAAVDTTLIVRPAQMEGARPFEGWGTALCWWANRLGYSDTLAQLSADLFYGDHGLRMNIMRYNIGGGDDPTHDHITRTDSEVPGWLVWDEALGGYLYDYDADHNQLNVLQRSVKAAGEDAVVEVFANSPPYFMTVSGCTSGAQNPSDNNLREDCYDAFAKYLVDVTDYLQRNLLINVTSLSPMNEPDTDYWGAYSWKQEGCHYDPGETQSRMIIALAKALENSRSQNVIIAVSDETSPDKQINEYHAYSAEAKKLIGRINAHTYMEEGRKALGELAKQENINLWMSEVDGDGTAGENAGEMGSALWYGQKIIADINELSPTAWVMWQAIDNHISAEGYNGNKDYGMVDVNRGFWGIAVADHDREEIILTQKYYGMGQFTRYIRPGSTLIPMGDDALGAYDPQTKELVVVTINAAAKDKTVRVDLSAFACKGDKVQAIRTSGSMADGEHWAQLADIAMDGEGFTAELKGNSITTWIIDNVVP